MVCRTVAKFTDAAPVKKERNRDEKEDQAGSLDLDLFLRWVKCHIRGLFSVIAHREDHCACDAG